MANAIGDDVLDGGLTLIDTAATGIYICSADPTTYTEAITTFGLGSKTFAAGGAFGAPAAATAPLGRRVTSVAITDGTVTGTGSATKWAVVRSDTSKLYANGSLSAGQSVTSGNTWTLGAFDIKVVNS